MIEPQSTMLPVAESRPADVPQGKDEGFGAMLAQSLGVAPQVDPDAVQQINTNPQNGGQTQQDPASEQPTIWEQPGTQPIRGSAANALRALAAPPTAPGASHGPDVHGEQPGIESAPAGGPFEPTNPTGSASFVRGDRGVTPMPTLPTPPTTTPAPQRPVETIWKPSPRGSASEVVAPGVPADGDTASQPVATPPAGEGVPPVPQPPAGPAQAPGIAPSDPTRTPLGSQPPGDDADPTTPIFEPEVSGPGRAEVDRGGKIPEPPQLDATSTSAEAASKSAAAPGVTPVPEVPERVHLAADRTVRLDAAPAPAVADRPVTAEAGAVRTTESVSVDTVSGLGSAQQVGATTSVGNPPRPAGLQPQASALAERVMKAIDLQRTQPPPRSMVVDIPELEGLRLVVSVRSAGHVSVTPAANTANPDVFAPFATDLSRVLAERGFVMNGDSRRQGYNPHDQDEAPPAPSRSTGFRRPARVDNDLRI